MANEIFVKLSLAAQLSGSHVLFGLVGYLDLNGDNFVHQNQTVGIVDETLDLGDISGTPLLYLRNQDATNYVDVALDAAHAKRFARFKAGQSGIFVPGNATLHLKADTAACLMEVLALEAVTGYSALDRFVPDMPANGTMKTSIELTAVKSGFSLAASSTVEISTMTLFEHATFQKNNTPSLLFEGPIATADIDWLAARSRTAIAGMLQHASGSDDIIDLNEEGAFALLPMYRPNTYIVASEAGTFDCEALGLAES